MSRRCGALEVGSDDQADLGFAGRYQHAMQDSRDVAIVVERAHQFAALAVDIEEPFQDRLAVKIQPLAKAHPQIVAIGLANKRPDHGPLGGAQRPGQDNRSFRAEIDASPAVGRRRRRNAKATYRIAVVVVQPAHG
jgi:hypothetical protein